MTRFIRNFAPVLPVLMALGGVAVVGLNTAVHEREPTTGRDRPLPVSYRQDQEAPPRAVDTGPARTAPLVIEIRGYCGDPTTTRGGRLALSSDVAEAGGSVGGPVGANGSITIMVNGRPAVEADCQP